ncbi:OapC/ArvC family zinc-ribbon domain-containing protein [Halobaculum limi]|uniref:OapC/ArvC family zinc-ribbon domain-containing protein n=1 Tax=Halobaculum limi TaxID=3031916 RepID=UPI0024060906|nr:Zn-ribbon containing protein [Halobaculum sp. YSMS11]
MPHQCTNCGQTFGDGSKEMLSGCPGCGGNKFQYRPADAVDDADVTSEADATPETSATPEVDAPSRGTAADADTTPSTQTKSTQATTATDAGDAGTGPAPTHPSADAEDGAQASARTDVVSEEELAAAAESDATEPTAADAAVAESSVESDGSETVDPNLDALRQKLNDQFESIRIVSPGQYELNLMELYDREEYIISLREDGRYVIEMPEGWDDR